MKKFVYLSLSLLVVFLLVGCSDNAVSNGNPNKNYSDVIDDANKITIKEKVMSLAKAYEVYVDGEKVATVKGKIVNNFGDVFTVTDSNGNFLIKERQIKRWGVKFNRAAEITNQDDEVIGYIAEETFTKLFNGGYYFHFLDANKEEIGISDQIALSLLNKYKYYDKSDNQEYQVDGKFSLVDTYTIKKLVAEPKVPPLHAILMVCIQDAIHDADNDD